MTASSSRSRIRNLLRPNLKKSLGVDIGMSGIKVAEVSRGRHGMRWRSRAYHPFESPWNSEIPTASELGHWLLEQMPRTADGTIRDVTISLPTSLCVARIVRRQDVSTIGTQMTNELGPDAQWCAWQVPSKQPETEHLVSYGLRSDFAQSVGYALERCGYRCVRIDAHPLSLYRLQNLNASPETKPDGVIDWGWQSCVLMLGSKTGPGIMRDLPRCGLHELLANSADRMGCKPESVLSALRQSSEAQRPNEVGRRVSDHAHDILLPWIKRLAHEIDQTLRFAKRIGCMTSTNSLLLCGGGGCLPNVPTMLSSETSLDIRRWRWSGDKRFHSSAWSPPDAIFANALSLAATDLIDRGSTSVVEDLATVNKQ